MTLKINFGCGKRPIKGWVNVDNSFSLLFSKNLLLTKLLKYLNFFNKTQYSYIEYLNRKNIVYGNARKKLNFQNDSVDIIYTSHMLEHLSRMQAHYFLNECHRILKRGGLIRIVVPDLRAYIN